MRFELLSETNEWLRLMQTNADNGMVKVYLRMTNVVVRAAVVESVEREVNNVCTDNTITISNRL